MRMEEVINVMNTIKVLTFDEVTRFNSGQWIFRIKKQDLYGCSDLYIYLMTQTFYYFYKYDKIKDKIHLYELSREKKKKGLILSRKNTKNCILLPYTSLGKYYEFAYHLKYHLKDKWRAR